MDWVQKQILLAQLCSIFIEWLINPRKVKTENLKFKKDLWDQVMDGWSVTQVNDYLE